jgi:protein TonB
MSAVDTTRSRKLALVMVSLAVHSALLTIGLVWVFRPRVVEAPAKQPLKYYHALLAIPGGARAPETKEPPGRKKHFVPAAEKTSALTLAAKPAPAKGAPVDAHHDPVAGNGLDAQSASPAFPVFSPRPQVADRALLPPSDRQVIVDVKLNASGEVLEATLVQGIGNALDQLVLDTVKTWRFQPATLNGSPVATESELIFPFNQSYPTSPS